MSREELAGALVAAKGALYRAKIKAKEALEVLGTADAARERVGAALDEHALSPGIHTTNLAMQFAEAVARWRRAQKDAEAAQDTLTACTKEVDAALEALIAVTPVT